MEKLRAGQGSLAQGAYSRKSIDFRAVRAGSILPDPHQVTQVSVSGFLSHRRRGDASTSEGRAG